MQRAVLCDEVVKESTVLRVYLQYARDTRPATCSLTGCAPVLASAREGVVVIHDAHRQLAGEDEDDEGHRAQPSCRKRPLPAERHARAEPYQVGRAEVSQSASTMRSVVVTATGPWPQVSTTPRRCSASTMR